MYLVESWFVIVVSSDVARLASANNRMIMIMFNTT